MTSHTPGPWYRSWSGQWICVDGPRGRVELAQVFREAEFKTSLPEKANGDLIAAAPDLLDALRRSVDWLAFLSERGLAHDVLDIARAAIAKAEGKS
jgi:hypothetical protein